MADWSGVDPARAVGTPVCEIFPAFASPVYSSRLDPLFHGGPPVVFSPHLHGKLFQTREGETALEGRHVQTTASSAELDGEQIALFSVQDVTAELERSRLLRQQSEQRHALLREHHHRTKNNLMMLASLLQLQKSQLHDSRDEEIMDVFVTRVMSIQRVHEHLYKGGDSFNLELGAYVSDLVSDVLHANIVTRIPDVSIETDEVELAVNQAIPLGMILAELITNTLKYAIGPEGGRITIRGTRNGTGRLVLTYRDSGPGRRGDGTGTGSELNTAFAEQLGGTLTLEPGPGAVTVLEFPVGAPGARQQ
jgi:two-component sensor histidine kinase